MQYSFYSFIEVFAVFLIFVCPSLSNSLSHFLSGTVPEVPAVQNMSFFQLAVYFIAALFFTIRSKSFSEDFSIPGSGKTRIPMKTWQKILYVSITYVLITANGLLWSLTGQKSAMEAEISLFSVSGTLIYAFFEESLFRFYLPKACNIPVKRQISPQAAICFSALVFAACHLYMGIPAFFNAFIAALILHFSAARTDSILCNVLAHTLYNLTALVLMTLL